MKRFLPVCILLVITMLVLPVSASDFRIFGPKAMSMGGAGVARPDGAFAAYWNPAALAHNPDSTKISLSVGFGGRDTGLTDHLQNLIDMDLNWEQVTSNPLGPDATAVVNELTQINTDDAAFLFPGGALAYKCGKLGLGLYPSAQVAIFVDVDNQHINQTDPLIDPNSFFYNSTELYMVGLGVFEAPIAYAKSWPLKSGTVSVGGAAKFIYGATYLISQNITDEFESMQSKLTDSHEFTMGFGVDLGVTYENESKSLALGLVAKNLNEPEFDVKSGGTFSEDMQIRAGLAYNITKSLSTAFDIDLSENATVVPAYNTRWAGGGLCWQATGGISLRGGVMKNIADSGSDMVVCAGLSMGFETLHLDLSAALPTEWNEVEEFKFPTEANIIFTMTTEW